MELWQPSVIGSLLKLKMGQTARRRVGGGVEDMLLAVKQGVSSSRDKKLSVSKDICE